MIDVKSIADIASYLRSRGEILKPLSVEKILEVEQQAMFPLPKVYKNFLLLMGNGAGKYMEGSSVFYSEIFLLKEGVNELILENELPSLPSEAFVFWMHQGYQAAYFKLGYEEDPAVYFFSEGSPPNEFYLKEKSLTNFFIAQLEVSGFS